MTCDELIAQAEVQNRRLLERGMEAAAKLDDEAWNRAPSGGWSPAQIFEHLILTNTLYIEKVDKALEAAPKGGQNSVRHTWFGKFIIKSAGPGGNAPAPKTLHPRPGPYSREVLDRWSAQQQQIIELHARAKDADLSRVKLRNPLIKLFGMNLSDCFAIFATHTERHILQIEDRAKS